MHLKHARLPIPPRPRINYSNQLNRIIRRTRYFFAGTGAVCGFAAGADCFAGCLPSSTVVLTPALRIARMESASDVIIKTMAEIVVAFESKVADPRGPNAVCEPMPPNAPARSAALPLCNSTTMIRKMQTTT